MYDLLYDSEKMEREQEDMKDKKKMREAEMKRLNEEIKKYGNICITIITEYFQVFVKDVLVHPIYNLQFQSPKRLSPRRRYKITRKAVHRRP